MSLKEGNSQIKRRTIKTHTYAYYIRQSCVQFRSNHKQLLRTYYEPGTMLGSLGERKKHEI